MGDKASKGANYWKYDESLFAAWIEGRVGVPIIDAAMKELRTTGNEYDIGKGTNINGIIVLGFMGNRARQVNHVRLFFCFFWSHYLVQMVASFLAHDLKIDWRWGAAYFEQQLLDHDVSSNYGNWCSIAPNDKYFNTIKQTLVYDKQNEYAKHWLPATKSIPNDKVHNSNV